MGIAFVLIIYSVVGGCATLLGGAVFAILARLILKRSSERKRLVRRAALFPFLCAVWAAVVFVLYAAVNLTLLHRDIGLGDGFDIPLPDHYAISYTDTLDYGIVYNPGSQPAWLSPSEQGDAVDDVRFLQMEGRFLAGSADRQLSHHFGEAGTPVNRFFVIDTSTNQRTDFASEQELSQWTTAHGFGLRLEPIAGYYARYRRTWFDGVAAAVLLLPPFFGFVTLSRAVSRARPAQQLKSDNL